ncbi:MAG: twin-arginine translocase TatA/TatE family subunit [Chloroflexota bacterium]|nr:twin-arginine translocase TatA/TatE family subunit [Chloroflexota bacterium]
MPYLAALPLAAIGGLGAWEIVAIVAVVLIIFGVGKLPQAMGAMGKGIRSFKKGAAGEDVDAATMESKKEKDAGKEPDGKEESGS